MNRRKLFRSLTGVGLSMPFFSFTSTKHRVAREQSKEKSGGFAKDGNHIRFFNPGIEKTFQITMLADTHLFTDDMRGEPYLQYSGRMAKAYNQTKHFQTGLPTNPEESFRKTLTFAQEEKSDMVALVGDILSFPSEAGIEWVIDQLDQAGLPYLYTAGNHDWHYEGMEGAHTRLREIWCEKRLKPLYQGGNPLMGVRVINGVRFISIDNSNYEILPEQLAFFKQQAAFEQPMILLVHIPLYAPGRAIGYGCGHPLWSATTDKNFEVERRERWPETGHTSTTFEFREEVFGSTHLMGILAGHIHKPTLDLVNGVPQIVVDANATGAYLKVECIPSS